MSFYRTCPRCGANLDPGEHCDCQQEKMYMRVRFEKIMKTDPKTGQFSFALAGGESGGEKQEA